MGEGFIRASEKVGEVRNLKISKVQRKKQNRGKVGGPRHEFS